MREDRIELALLSRLSEAEFTNSDIGQIKDRWDAADAHKDIDASRRSVLARIEALETKLARMTDLLIDGTLDKQSFETSKQTTNFDLSQLRGQLDLMPNPAELRKEQAEYIKLFSSLVDTYRAGARAERRELLQNAFCVRHLLPGEVRLVVRDWVDVRHEETKQNNSKLLLSA